MTLQDYFKKLTAQEKLQSKTQLKHLRDLDEESKGHFVAFYDEGSTSYDVQIRLNPTDASLIDLTCDCKPINSNCEHIQSLAALLLSGKNTTHNSLVLKRIKPKKLSKLEKKVLDIESDLVVQWIIKELSENTELALKFDVAFSTSTLTFTKNAIQEYHKQCTKSVLGRRKRSSSGEVGKILKLAASYHDEFVIWAQNTSDLKNIVGTFLEINTYIKGLDYSCKTSTTRVDTYTKKYFPKLTQALILNQKIKLSELIIELIKHDDDLDFPYNILIPLLRDKKSPQYEKELKYSIDIISEKLLDLPIEDQISLIEIITEKNLFRNYYKNLHPHPLYFSDYHRSYLKAFYVSGMHKELESFCHNKIQDKNEPHRLYYFDALATHYIDQQQKDKLLQFYNENYFKSPTPKHLVNYLEQASDNQALFNSILDKCLKLQLHKNRSDYPLILHIRLICYFNMGHVELFLKETESNPGIELLLLYSHLFTPDYAFEMVKTLCKSLKYTYDFQLIDEVSTKIIDLHEQGLLSDLDIARLVKSVNMSWSLKNILTDLIE